MAQNIVDVSWDLAKFDEQTQAVLANMTKVYDLANQAKATGIKLGSDGGFTELKKNVTDFNKVQEQSLKLTALQEKAEQARIKTQKDAALAAKARDAAEQQRLKTQSAQLDLTKKQTAADEKAAAAKKSVNDISLIIRNKGDDPASAETTAAFEAQRRAEADASMAAIEYGNSVNKSTTALKEREVVSKQTSAESIRDKEIQKQLERQAAQELKNNVREQIAAKGSLEQRRAALIRLNAVYDHLNASERNSPYGARLQKTIAGVTTQVKELEAATGRAQRNVGNYPNALEKFGTRVESVFRRLAAYVSIFAVFNFFKTVVGDTLEAENALVRFKATLDNLGRSDVFGRLDSKAEQFTDRFKYLKKEDVLGVFELLINYGKLTENQITALIPVITNFAAKQRISIVEATPIIIKALAGQGRGLKQYGIDVKDAHSVTERLGMIMDDLGPKVEGAADAFGKTTQGKIAQTKEDFVKLKEEIGNGLLPTINKLLAGFDNLINRFRNMHSDIDLNTSAFGRMWEKIQNLLPSRGTDSNGQTLQEHLDSEMARKFGGHQVANPGNGVNTFILPDDLNPNGNKILGTGGRDRDKTKKEHKAVVLESVKNELDLEFELYKISQQHKIKLLDEEQNDTKKSLAERMLAAEDFTKASIELSDKTYQHEIANDKEKLKIMEINFKRLKKGTEKNNLAVEIENTGKEIKVAQAKQNDERLALQEAFGKKYLEIAKDTEAERLRILEKAEKAIENVRIEQHNAIEANRASEKAAHDNLLHDKIISQEKYDKLEKKSIKENAILQAQSDLQKAQRMKDLVFTNSRSTTEDKNNAVNNVTTANANLISAQNTDDKTDKGLEKRQEIVKDAQLITQTIDSLVDIGYQKEINAIQKIIDLNEERKNREIANINASTLSNQEKAAQMLLLDNTVAANNKKLKREQVAVQIKQAKFDRDMAVLGILENVATANFKLIAQGGFAGIAAGVAVGLQAVSAIAMLMAKPLPQMPAYAKGTDNHPGGPAIVGEGQYKELVTEPGGKSFIASRPMLLNNLPKGSKVTPLTNEMIMASMTQSANASMAERMVASNSIQAEGNRVELTAIKEAVYETGRMTAQALRKQKGANVVVNVDSKFYAHIMKVVKE